MVGYHGFVIRINFKFTKFGTHVLGVWACAPIKLSSPFSVSSALKTFLTDTSTTLSSICQMAWYDYKYNFPVQRETTVKCFTPFLLFFGLLFVIAITLVNVMAVGYDTISFTSTSTGLNETQGMWYDKLAPWKGTHRNCTPALLKLNDCIPLRRHFLTLDMYTSSDFTFFLYQLLDYIQPVQASNTAFSPINELNYSNNPFSDCSLTTLQMVEYLEPVSPQLKSTVWISIAPSKDDNWLLGYCWMQYNLLEFPLLTNKYWNRIIGNG